MHTLMTEATAAHGGRLERSVCGLAMTTNHNEEGILHRSCLRRQHMELGSHRLEPVTC